MIKPSIHGRLTLTVLVLAIVVAVPAYAQTYSVLYNFGTKALDPSNPFYSGIVAQGRDGNLYSTTPNGGANAMGAVFKITPGGTLTILYSFDGAHGATPYGGLTLGTDGNFYGTTASGGSGYGNIFKITPSGSLTVLYTFTGGFDEGIPYAPPIQGTDGNFYGTTFFSTSCGQGCGTVYKITPSGTFTTLYQFDSLTGSDPYAPLVQGTDGNFYGTTSYDNSAGGEVFKITPAGKLTVLHIFDGVHGLAPFGPLVQGSDGNFYGTTMSGGTGGNGSNGVVFKITPSGTLSVLHNLNGTTDGSQPTAGLVQASDGNFYGSTSVGGNSTNCSGCGTIFKITPQGTYSVLYTFDGTTGAYQRITLLQDTSGILYGDTYQGGTGNVSPCAAGACGVFYSLNIGAAEFVRLQTTSGKVGSSVSILGQGFTGTTAVSFNGVNAITFSIKSDTYLTATVPSGAKTGTVTVVRPSGSLNSIQQFKVTPAISSIVPTSGPIGTVVTINGTGLTQTTKVTFGGVNATAVTIISDSKVSATVPSGAKTGKITVTTAGGSAASSSSFSVTPTISSFSPSSGKVGTVVTVTGTGLIQTTKVTFGGVAATTFTVNSDTKVTATVPTGATTGPISVTTPGGTATSATNFTVTP